MAAGLFYDIFLNNEAFNYTFFDTLYPNYNKPGFEYNQLVYSDMY